jgi:hypothetical protein
MSRPITCTAYLRSQWLRHHYGTANGAPNLIKASEHLRSTSLRHHCGNFRQSSVVRPTETSPQFATAAPFRHAFVGTPDIGPAVSPQSVAATALRHPPLVHRYFACTVDHDSAVLGCGPIAATRSPTDSSPICGGHRSLELRQYFSDRRSAAKDCGTIRVRRCPRQ